MHATVLTTETRPKRRDSSPCQERAALLQEQAVARKKYYKERAKTRALLTERTSKGQPRLANQIGHILQKLQGERRKAA